MREVAQKDRNARFTALLHHVSLERLVMAYRDLSPKAAPGVDGVTWESSGRTWWLTSGTCTHGDYIRGATGGPFGGRRQLRRRTGGSGRSASRRSRHNAALSNGPLGFVIVAHPFHPLNGQRLEILYAKRRGPDTVFVCAGGVSGQIAAAGMDRPGRAARDFASYQAEGLAALGAATRALQGR